MRFLGETGLFGTAVCLVGCVSARRLLEPRQHSSTTNDAEEELFHVMVRTAHGHIPLPLQERHRVRSHPKLQSISTVVTRKQLQELEEDPEVLDMEEDVLVFPDQTEDATLFSMQMIQVAEESSESTSKTSTMASNSIPRTASCRDPDSFKIGIIDSGLAVEHPDIPCLPIEDENTNCMGTEINLKEKDGLWHNPVTKYHGTHVAGVIGASGRNNAGMQGVIGDGNFCFLIARVFGETGSGTRMSDILEAVEWMVEHDANIINMSLGSGEYTKLGDAIMQYAFDEGILLIGSSGNDGTNREHYPANFDHVLSVAAVGEDLSKADFSQYNSGVDIAAPGVDILSTFSPSLGQALFLSSSELGAIGLYMTFSSAPTLLSGALVVCPEFGLDICPGPGDHICLIERGEIKFEQKALNCEAGGGAAAVIYNNAPGLIGGTLTELTNVKIPVAEIRQVAGHEFLKTSLGSMVTLELRPGYGFKSGTSMAAPHVTGVAAKIWRQCPNCTNADLETCLIDTTIDLGEAGKDVNFGWGLVQAENALECLVETIQCCAAMVEADESSSEPSQVLTSTSPFPLSTNSTSTPRTLSPERMTSVMLDMESLLNLTEPPASTIARLEAIFEPGIEFTSTLSKIEGVDPFFQARLGVSAQADRVIHIIHNTTIVGTRPYDVAFGENLMYYRHDLSGRLALDSPPVAMKTLVKLAFSDAGKISNIVLAVFELTANTTIPAID